MIVRCCLAATMTVAALAACGDHQNGFDCQSLRLTAQPATARTPADLRLRVRATDHAGRPRSGLLLSFQVETPSGQSQDMTAIGRTDGDGWAEAVVPEIDLKVHNTEVEQRLASASGYTVWYTSALSTDGQVPVCNARTQGAVAYTGG